MTRLHHLARVAHYEEGAYRLAFTALAADLDRQVDDHLEGFQRHPRFKITQVEACELAEMLFQAEHADRVDDASLKAAVDGDHLGLWSDHLRRHALQQCLGKTLVHRQARHIERHAAQSVVCDTNQMSIVIGGHEYWRRAGKAADPLPIEPLLNQQEHRLRRRGLEQPCRCLKKLFELPG